MSSTTKNAAQTGSFSPASPPYYAGIKAQKPAAFTPATPTSPPMSSGTQTYASAPTSSNHTVRPAASTQDTQLIPETQATTNGELTPSPSTSLKRKFSDGGEQLADGQRSTKMVKVVGPDLVSEEADAGGQTQQHNRTNHDREELPDAGDGDAMELAPSQPDTAPKVYRICQRPYTKAQPDISTDLMALYGLDSFSKTLRRYKPENPANPQEAFEKDVKFRKSYGNYLKSLKIAGRNNAPFHKDLLCPRLTAYPQEEWYAQNVHGKDISMAALAGKLDRALQMAKGSLPTSDRSKSKVDEEGGETDVVRKVAHLIDTGDGGKKKEAKTATAATAQPAAARTPLVAPTVASAIRRPERLGTKRSYQDDSFVGYGEGFADDFGSDLTEDDGKGGGRGMKRRKKSSGVIPTSLGQSSQQPFGIAAGVQQR